MQTTMLWTSGVFSTATMFSPCMPEKPRLASAADASSSSQALKPGSVQALATAAAPFFGPTLFWKVSISASRASGSTSPLSKRIVSMAFTLSAGSDGSNAWVALP